MRSKHKPLANTIAFVKCDFCNKEAIGCGTYQCAIYCAEHEKEADKIENDMLDEIDDYKTRIKQ